VRVGTEEANDGIGIGACPFVFRTPFEFKSLRVSSPPPTYTYPRQQKGEGHAKCQSSSRHQSPPWRSRQRNRPPSLPLRSTQPNPPSPSPLSSPTPTQHLREVHPPHYRQKPVYGVWSWKGYHERVWSLQVPVQTEGPAGSNTRSEEGLLVILYQPRGHKWFPLYITNITTSSTRPGTTSCVTTITSLL